MEPGISHSITHHPHPFHLQPPSPRSNSHTPHAVGTPDIVNGASSTAVELVEDQHSQRHHSGGGVSSGGNSDDVGHNAALGEGGGAASTTRQRAPLHHTASINSNDGRDVEVESQTTAGRRMPLYSSENDPYGFSRAYKTAADIEQIKANTSRKLRSRRGGVLGWGRRGNRVEEEAVPVASLGGGSMANENHTASTPARLVSPWYPHRVACVPQRFNTLERLLKSVEEHREDARHEAGEDLLQFRVGVWGSFAANIVLAALQIYAAVASGSLSLFTTMADSIFDPLSNLTLILSNRAVRRVDPSRFPSGKARLETVGNIVFCFLMTSVSLILIAFSAQELAQRAGQDGTNGFHLPSVVAVSVAFATKLSLFLYTWALKDRYSQIRILWQDHRNDLFVNAFGILTSVGGAKLVWWVDPMGAIILSVVISFLWLRTAFSEFMLLVGVVASVEKQQLITYVCVRHSPAIKQIDTVRVYHSGPRLIAEVDVVMDPDATLHDTHDVAEELQIKLESLPDIERAYVHVDYETTHKPEHFFKKDL
ncbi:cation diffusion facilitator 1 [Magnaporthiopsis poae ATCC 64411]|uniref:Cation diffusion facilitator 1 n=1 Tax=Magnaporthiopsis poae (strain ATCC 64411 / 73-15) TaxID=644358 RepID=A0A0C4E5J2_MAGP6|nr:cation diffusion facilitator 1 [Magnaporthiopsis poae ATCC 64411]